MNLLTIKSQFWRDVIRSWCIYNYKPIDESIQLTGEQLWFNSYIKINNKPIFYRPLYQAGIRHISDIIDNQGAILPADEILRKYDLSHKYLLIVNGIIAAVPQNWKTQLLTRYKRENVTNNLQSEPSNYTLMLSKNHASKFIYEKIIRSKL